ncbi:MAG: polysaccharide deacetylase family protein [Candidatus Omnitrophica bacterium]|nr:polysaccharide deacetylase family protein [Candidatus Omnitrophota bacterium]MBU1924638.1 polysaccharide deacetylase family protein [Candidatus Omnitrophota bacterium]
MKAEKNCCLTLDLESDHGLYAQDDYSIVKNNINEFIELMRLSNVKLTIFVTGLFLEKFPATVSKLHNNLKCEFALHSYYHRTNSKISAEEEIVFSYKKFIDFFGHPPLGYRGPYGKISADEIKILKDLGFVYHSAAGWFYPQRQRVSLYPQKKGIYTYQNNLIEIPVSRSYFIGVPLGIGYVNFFNLRSNLDIFYPSDPLVLYFHLHDLFKTAAFKKLPLLWKLFYFNKEYYCANLHKEFIRLITNLRNKGYKFLTIQEHLVCEKSAKNNTGTGMEYGETQKMTVVAER